MAADAPPDASHVDTPSGSPRDAALAFVSTSDADPRDGGEFQRKINAETRTAVALAHDLGVAADGVVTELRAQILMNGAWGKSSEPNRRALYLLAAIDTPTARRLLIDVVRDRARVYGRNLFLQGEAVSSAVRTTLDAAAARELLALNDADVSAQVVNRAIDGPLAEALRADVVRALTDPAVGVRGSAAYVVSSWLLREQATDLAEPLFRHLDGAEDLPDGRREVGGMDGPPRTRGEFEVAATTKRLAERAPTQHLLRDWKRRAASALLRDCAAVALADTAHDADELATIRRVVSGSARPWLRAWATQALGTVGNENDLPTLDDLAANEPATSISHVTGESYSPVRTTAKSAAEAIRQRLASTQPK